MAVGWAAGSHVRPSIALSGQAGDRLCVGHPPVPVSECERYAPVLALATATAAGRSTSWPIM